MPMAKVWSQDDKQAAFWFRKAAEQGYAEAQLILGLMYNEGQGGLEQGLQPSRHVVSQGSRTGLGNGAIQSWRNVCQWRRCGAR